MYTRGSTDLYRIFVDNIHPLTCVKSDFKTDLFCFKRDFFNLQQTFLTCNRLFKPATATRVHASKIVRIMADNISHFIVLYAWEKKDQLNQPVHIFKYIYIYIQNIKKRFFLHVKETRAHTREIWRMIVDNIDIFIVVYAREKEPIQ